MKKNLFIVFITIITVAIIFACVTAGKQNIANTEESYTESGLSVRIPESAKAVDVVTSASIVPASSVMAVKAGENARGRITIYTSMYPEVFNDIEKAMERHFPDLDVFFVYGGTVQIQARIDAEIKNGKLGCDILMIADPSYSIELKEKGLLHPYASKEADNLAFYFDPDGYWYPVRISNMVFAYNPEKFNRDSVPQMFYEFGYSPDLRGMLSMGDPNTSGSTLVTLNALWDRYMGQKYFEYLGAQRVQIDSYADALLKLERGQIKAAMVLEETVLRKNQIEGSKLAIVYPSDGSVVIPSAIMVISEKWSMNLNTASATAIADWFLSEEGQNVIVSGWMHSVRKNFDNYPEGSKPTSDITANMYPVVWENVLTNRDEIRKNFQRYVKRR